MSGHYKMPPRLRLDNSIARLRTELLARHEARVIWERQVLATAARVAEPKAIAAAAAIEAAPKPEAPPAEVAVVPKPKAPATETSVQVSSIARVFTRLMANWLSFRRSQ
jgi:hypothetical protein